LFFIDKVDRRGEERRGEKRREHIVSRLCARSRRSALGTTLLQCHAVYS